MRIEKECANCKRKYIAYVESSKYCSNKCKYKIEGIKERECPVCKNKFKPKSNRDQIHCNIQCYSKSDKLKEEARNSYLIECNKEKKWNVGHIKENVGRSALHEWIRKYKPKTNGCEICDKEAELDAANISGDYKRDINDFIWLCRSCHTRFDKMKKLYEVIGVESKKAKYLDAKEKKMAIWLLDNKIFSKIYIAYPIKDGRKKTIVYQRFER
jgi:hypothetical protein